MLALQAYLSLQGSATSMQATLVPVEFSSIKRLPLVPADNSMHDWPAATLMQTVCICTGANKVSNKVCQLGECA